MDYKIILFSLILVLINYFLTRFKLLVDDPNESFHKIEKKSGTPLSGGIFIFVSLIFLLIFKIEFLLTLNIFIIFILILTLGILSDIKKNFSPKFRIIFQLLIIFLLILINNDIQIYKTNIKLLDLSLNNDILRFTFTAFCIITLLNGLNFMDGVNSFVSGYVLLILITLNLIVLKITNQTYFNDYIYIFFVFFIFNSFGKCFLGDNGIYISTILISFIVINTLNLYELISPISAVSLLWYPAIENLFTILRRFYKKKLLFLPDKFHLHSLIFENLDSKFKNLPQNYKNTITGFILIIFLIPNFLFTYFFYNKSNYLAYLVIIYIFVYIISYILLLKNKSMK